MYKILPSYFSQTHKGRVSQIGKALKKYQKNCVQKAQHQKVSTGVTTFIPKIVLQNGTYYFK